MRATRVRLLRPARRLPLRTQLISGVGFLLLAAFAVLFLVVVIDTERQLVSQIDGDLRPDVAAFAASLRSAAGNAPSPGESLRAAAERYFRAQHYGANVPLLFALTPEGALSNHPELFGDRRADDGESPNLQRRENAQGAALLAPALGLSTRFVPDAGEIRLLEQRIVTVGGPVVVAAGLPMAGAERAQHDVGRAFLLFGLVILAIALLAAYLAGGRVSAPLRRMARVARRVDAGELAPRIELASGSSEMEVLAESFNHMLDRLEEAFRRQREFVADASHELRTPITVIRGQLEVLAAAPDPSAEDVRRVERLVAQEIARISRLVDDMLVLAQLDRADFLHPQTIEVQSFVRELWEGAKLMAERSFELGDVPAGTLRADPDRLAQALRNLFRNAVEHTTAPDGLVRLEAEPEGPASLRFAVVDDGPGIPTAERERVFERFHRIDRSRARARGGTGLGLSIVREIAWAHGGDAVARGRAAGQPGARVELVLPGFTAGRAQPPEAAQAAASLGRR